MKTLFRKALAICGLIAIGAIFAGNASAQCNGAAALPPELLMQKQSWHGQQGHLMFVDWRDDEDGIVGFWNIVLTSKGSSGIPDGTVLDKGLQQWHADGTEFLNSSGQKPLTQNYCLGVWEKTGPATYSLNHFAYNYDASQTVIGITRIREEVTLNRDGSKFAGTFLIDAYDTLRNHLGRVKGTVTGNRIDVHTDAQNVL